MTRSAAPSTEDARAARTTRALSQATPARVARLRRWSRLVFLVPAGLFVLFAFALPVAYNLLLSFQQTGPATISTLFAPFAGLTNYKLVLFNSTTQDVIVRTFLFTVGSLFFQFLIGLALAL